MLAQSMHCRGFSKKNDSVLEQSEAALDTFFKDDSVLETSVAALNTFSKNLAVTTGKASILFLGYCVDGCVWWG